MKRHLLVLATSLALAVPAVLAPATARAESVEARQPGDVFSAPGEQSRVVTRVRAGASMTVLSRSGRWLKVRVNGRTGWIPRSYVATDTTRAPRKTRRAAFVQGRSTKRGKRGAPRDRVGGDAVEGAETTDGFIDEGDAPTARPAEPAEADEPADDRGEALDDEDPLAAGDGDEADGEDPGEDVEADGEDGEGDGEGGGDGERAAETAYVVSPSAVLFADPTRKSEHLDRLLEGTRVTVLERGDRWVRVDAGGTEGWVRAEQLGERGRYRYAKRTWRLGAGLGFTRLTQTFASTSTEPLGNYQVSASSIAIGIDGELIWDYSPTLLVKGDLSYRYGYATPGIRCIPERCGGDDAVDVGFTTHDVALGVALGYKLWREHGIAAYGRLGYAYGMFQVADVGNPAANPARFASESLSGNTIGVQLDAPRLGAWAFQAGVDVLWPFASRVQTAGLEDGDLSDSFALWAGLRAAYDWRNSLKATAELSYARATTTWTGVAEESMRAHGAESATRTDAGLIFLLGVMRPF